MRPQTLSPATIPLAIIVILANDNAGFFPVGRAAWFYVPALLAVALLTLTVSIPKCKTIIINGYYTSAFASIFFILIVHYLSIIPELKNHGTTTALSQTLILGILLLTSASYAIYFGQSRQAYLYNIAFAFGISSLFHSTLALLGFTGILAGIQDPNYLRLQGIAENPNFLAQVLAPGFISFFVLGFIKSRFIKLKTRKIYQLFSIMILISLFLTASRAWIFSTALAILIGTLVTITGRRRILAIASLAVFALIAANIMRYLAESDIITKKILTIDSPGRVLILIKMSEVMSQAETIDWIIGKGNGWFLREYRSTHSSWGRFLIDYGLIGFFVLLLAMTGIFRALYKKTKNFKQAAFLVSSTFVLCVSGGIFQSGIFSGSNPDYWFLVFIFGFLLTRDNESGITYTSNLTCPPPSETHEIDKHRHHHKRQNPPYI